MFGIGAEDFDLAVDRGSAFRSNREFSLARFRRIVWTIQNDEVRRNLRDTVSSAASGKIEISDGRMPVD